MGLTCAELIDEIQAALGRTENVRLVDVTWVTRRINEAQKLIVEKVPLIPSVTFKNTTSVDTTGAICYPLSDITVGDSTNQRPCHVTDVWYLDGASSRQLRFVPTDQFDMEHPDPTHSDAHFDKPVQWTRRGPNIELYPYCASAYWNTNLRFDGDFYARDFSTDSTQTSDISRADEGLITYGVWQGWKAIGDEGRAERWRKQWSNPNPLPGEDVGWLEQFRYENEELIAWSGNLYDDVVD